MEGLELVEISNLLQQEEFAIDQASVKACLEELKLRPRPNLSNQLAWLKQRTHDAEASNLPCGLNVFLFDTDEPDVLDLRKRTSNRMFVRDFYASLFTTITDLLQEKKQIILTGNAGIGKSWFQVYFLYRLLNEGENQPFRFVVRQVETEFYLMDIVTCRGWEITGSAGPVKALLKSLKKTLYLYEPLAQADQPPLSTFAPSLSTLSPRPSRIKEYKKQFSAVLLYMPVWELDELMAIATLEGRNLEDTESNFGLFGGIIRYTLGDSRVIDEATKDLDNRCNSTSIEVFRSIMANIDDSSNADQKRNISGFLVCYTDIPREGPKAFATWSLEVTSEHAFKKIQEKFNAEGPVAKLDALASHLSHKSEDVTGIDLESSVVEMLASGPATVKWYYCSIRDSVPFQNGEFRHTKRTIRRMSDFDKAALNYPTNRTFGLVDCFMFINSAWCAFQITWQDDHPFKLRTLLNFREKLGVRIQDTVNIYFVNPIHGDLYKNRRKLDYLVKGESPESPIVNNRGRVLLKASDVSKMWENTKIFVAYLEGDWLDAVKICSASLQPTKSTG